MDNGVFSVLRDNNCLCKVLYFTLPNYQSSGRTEDQYIQAFRNLVSLTSISCLSYKLLEVHLAKGENKPRKPKTGAAGKNWSSKGGQ